MKYIQKTVLIVIVLAVSLSIVLSDDIFAQSARKTIKIGGVIYPPFFFEDGSGAGTDMLTELLDTMGYDTTIELYPLGRAINMVNEGAIESAFLFPQTDPDVTVTMPLFYSAAVFVYKKSRFPNGVSYNALSELKDYKIGALTGSQWSIRLLQEEAGLTLDFAPANDMNMKKLESERIDLLPLFHITALSLMESVFPGKHDEFGVTAPFSITPLCLIFSTTYPGNTAIIDDVTGKLAEIDRQVLLQKHFGKYFPQGIVPPHTVTGEISE